MEGLVDLVHDQLVDEPGMNKLSDVDAVTPSYPTFLPSNTWSKYTFWHKQPL